MFIRVAAIKDISRMQIIRNSVKENMLSDPGLVPDADYEKFMIRRGKGWVCEVNDRIAGFAIVDLQAHNIWALFVHPDFEKLGIGKLLHDTMLEWYFNQSHDTVWLGTAPNTRAETFYRKAGWAEAGLNGKNEIKFEMSYSQWVNPASHC